MDIDIFNNLDHKGLESYFSLTNTNHNTLFTWLDNLDEKSGKVLYAKAFLHYRNGKYGSNRILLLQSINEYPDYFPSYDKLVYTHGAHMLTIEQLNKYIHDNPSPLYEFMAYKELAKRYYETNDIGNFTKAFTKVFPKCLPYYNSDMTFPFIIHLLNENSMSINQILEIFGENEEEENKKNLRLIYQLCDEIRSLRKKVDELTYMPGGPEYQEAAERFEKASKD